VNFVADVDDVFNKAIHQQRLNEAAEENDHVAMTAHQMGQREQVTESNAHHPTAWYAEMTRKEKNTFWASVGGWVMEAMEVQMLAFATTGIMIAFAAAHITNADLAFVGTVTLVTSSVGGWFAGALADRVGRVRMLQIAIAWFAVFSVLCGFAQNYTQLLVLRGLMGFGFGGEWAVAAVLVGEVIAPQHRGKAVGAMQSGWAVGWAVGWAIGWAISARGATPFSVFSEDFAWRVMFWAGLLPAVLVFFARRFIEEPPVFTEARKQQENAGKTVSFLDIFKAGMLPTTILACVLSIGVQGGHYAITFWLPKFLRDERGLTVLRSGDYLAIIIIGSFIGYLVSAWLNDCIGRRLNFILFAVCSVAIVIVYTLIPIDNTVMLALGFPLGFLASGIFSGMGPILTELYPTHLRGSGQSFAYNFGRAVAALNVWFVGLFVDVLHVPLGQSIGIFALTAYGLVVVAALLLPETRCLMLAPYQPIKRLTTSFGSSSTPLALHQLLGVWHRSRTK
jgi:MFS family permease